jgi:predicted secreted protein
MKTLLSLMLFLLTSSIYAAEPNGHRFVASDREKGKTLIIGVDGKTEWELENKHDVHDIHMLANGNLLTHTSHTTIVEINSDKKIVWKYEAKPKAGYNGRVEVHAFQRLADGNTMIAESGNTRIIEVNSDGKIVKEVPLKVAKPDSHRDTRMVRKTDAGHYLVCHEGEGTVREYDGEGKVVWEYTIDLAGRPRSNGHGVEGHGVELYGAVRLKNGNTLIAGGNNNRVVEVTADKKIVWQVDQKDLPEVTLAWVTTLHVLPNGNIIIGNCHAGKENPQLIEVNREKKIVWKFQDFERFGNSLASCHILEKDVIR